MTDRPTVVVEDQERPLIWTGGLDPDPLNPTEIDSAYEQGYVDGLAHSVALDAARKRRRDHLGIVAVLAAAAALLIVGYAAGRASAAQQETAPRGRAASGNPASGAPAAAGDIGSATTAGVASWYDDGPGLYAAVPSWSFGDTQYQVLVRAGDRSVVVTVRDFCGCPGARIIDLSPDAFVRLAPLSRGLVVVTVERLDARITAPPTDLEP